MSEFLSYNLHLSTGDAVRVTLRGHASDVFLVDDVNFHAFRNRRSFSYHGGHMTSSPVVVRPPHGGHWHLVVMPSGGRVEASVQVIAA